MFPEAASPRSTRTTGRSVQDSGCGSDRGPQTVRQVDHGGAGGEKRGLPAGPLHAGAGRHAREGRRQQVPFGKAPMLIDEWRVIPFIWDAVRFEVDKRREFGQFMPTGSVTPPNTDEITHSGTGRIARMPMRTMSLYESGDSKRRGARREALCGSTRGVGRHRQEARRHRLPDLQGRLARGGGALGGGGPPAGVRPRRRHACRRLHEGGRH